MPRSGGRLQPSANRGVAGGTHHTVSLIGPSHGAGSGGRAGAEVTFNGFMAYGGESKMEASHINALHNKHAGLERRIAEELKSPHPDPVTLQALKRHKLRIRDQIAHH
ncbi:YdcH family protein [Novosphingobium sp. SG751A]|uniref:YdcH family protein n=1 Tax=Novosphingobium sp. SG751A TaxID=2587000 RepID=UPI003530517F